MLVRPISRRLFSGMFTPAMRAMVAPRVPFLHEYPARLAGSLQSRRPPYGRPASALPLLVARVLADDQDHAAAADGLAFLTHRLDRCTYLQLAEVLPIRKYLARLAG